MTLKGHHTLCLKTHVCFRAQHRNLNADRSELSLRLWYSPMTLVSGNTRFLWIFAGVSWRGDRYTYYYRNWKKVDITSFSRYLLPLSSRTQPSSDADICAVQLNDDLAPPSTPSIVACSKYKVKAEKCRPAKDYNRGFGIIRHNSPKVAANDLYTYESKLFLRTIDNF